ncbi:MAG: CPBP family intramembrane metalloprotease [Planctomycetaceae bacterium]|nr:CPBP family intramembrane metalloprotease [Planctomycetaceae bacterium]
MTDRSRRTTRPDRADAPQVGSSLSAFAAQGYFAASRRPLEILFFLLPFIAFYEYELVKVLRSERGLLTNEAHRGLLDLFGAFGLDGLALSLPGFLLIAIFLAWHALSRGPWIVNLSVVGRMFVESLAAAVPLLVFSQVVLKAVPAAGVDDFASLTLGEQVAVSVGAGLYEELVFRMALIGVLLVVFGDLLKAPKPWASAIAIGLSALAFTVYHPLRGAEGVFVPQRFVFYFGAGVYFGILFAVRGFGITAATHAMYDIATALLVAGAAAPADAA